MGAGAELVIVLLVELFPQFPHSSSFAIMDGAGGTQAPPTSAPIKVDEAAATPTQTCDLSQDARKCPGPVEHSLL